jgi:DNA polymerase III epsilon subunit-like protein
MKYVFIDAEFTGEHSKTTLVSLGLVDLDGNELYLTLNDYDLDQVTDWLKDNVLINIDKGLRISSKQAYEKMSNWLEKYSDGEDVSIVSAGLGADWILMAELYKWSVPGEKYFHGLYHLPKFLNHGKHLDLRSLFSVAGYNPDIDRVKFASKKEFTGDRHNAIYDARIVRDCFIKLLSSPELHFLNEM